MPQVVLDCQLAQGRIWYRGLSRPDDNVARKRSLLIGSRFSTMDSSQAI